MAICDEIFADKGTALVSYLFHSPSLDLFQKGNERNMAKKLSKSRIISGLQCVKRLHQEVYHPERAEISDATKQIFAQGNQIGDLACQQFPNGVLIDRNPLSEALRKTEELLKNPDCPPLFEATFEHEGVLVQADILIPGKEEVEIIEVKSSTKL